MEVGLSICVGNEGQYCLFGYTNSYGAGGYDMMLYFIDDQGAVLSSHTYGSVDWEFGTRIIPSDEGYLLIGDVYGSTFGGKDGRLMKIAENGEVLWEKDFGGEGDDELSDITLNDEGDIYLCGSKETSEGIFHAWITRLDSEGDLIWVKLYNEDAPDSEWRATGMTIVDNQPVVCGNYRVTLEDEFDIFLSKFDEIGELVWEKIDANPGLQVLWDVEAFSNGFITTGTTDEWGLGGLGAMLQRRSVGGGWLQGPVFGEDQDEESFKILIDAENRLLVLGSTNSYSEFDDDDIYLIRFEDPMIVSSYDLELAHYQDTWLNISETENTAGENVLYRIQNRLVFSDPLWHPTGVIMLDVSGRIVGVSRGVGDIDIANFPSGIYMIKSTDGAQTQIHRIYNP